MIIKRIGSTHAKWVPWCMYFWLTHAHRVDEYTLLQLAARWRMTTRKWKSSLKVLKAKENNWIVCAFSAYFLPVSNGLSRGDIAFRSIYQFSCRFLSFVYCWYPRNFFWMSRHHQSSTKQSFCSFRATAYWLVGWTVALPAYELSRLLAISAGSVVSLSIP